MLALKKPHVASYGERAPSESDQLRIVAEEAARIRQAHTDGTLNSTEAAKALSELKRRFAHPFDALLAL